MSIQSIGYSLIVIGVSGLIISSLADSMGIGKDPSRMGVLQLSGIALGIIFIIVGAFLARKKTPPTGGGVTPENLNEEDQ